MAFQIPQSKRSIAQNRFGFELDGKTYSLPLLKFAPVAAAEAFEREQNVTAFLLACDTDAARDAIRTLDGDQFNALAEAWQKASGVEPGESSASRDS